MAATLIQRGRLAANVVNAAKMDLTDSYNFGGTLQKSGVAVATTTDVETARLGLQAKSSVKCVATSNVTLSGEQTIDGVLTSASRVLLTGQTIASENGIYVTAAGAWARSTDLAAASNAKNTYCWIEQGTTYADTGWLCTNNAGSDVVGTDSLSYSQAFGSAVITASNGLVKTGNNIAPDYGEAGDVAAIGTANAAGSLDEIARADHVHELGDGSIDTITQITDDLITSAKLSTAARARLGGQVDVVEFFAGDGATVNFDLANVDNVLTEVGHTLYVDGLLQRLGGTYDYTMSDNGGVGGVDRIVFNTAPDLNSVICFRGRRSIVT